MMLLGRCVMLLLVAVAALGDSDAGPAPVGGPEPEPEPSPERGEGMLPGGPALRSPRVVHTRSGPLQGLILSMDGAGAGQRSLQPIEAFLGVPYATPPVGGNRFSPTRAPSPWDEVRFADRVRPACPQRHPDVLNETAAMERMPRGRLLQLKRLVPFLRTQSEDCLYLNIYTPAQAGSSDVQPNRPVLVYIHGESFSWNSGAAYDGSVLASYADVVVVTLNYRLGILGFLNANPSPGTRARVANYGLMDQLAALHWLQQNVALFGGDPRNVTLMGHGTGAACIHFLMMSPTVTSGLFQRAILMSGSAYSPWALVQDPVRAAVRVASRLNCTVPADLARDHEDIVDCLRNAPLDGLLDAAADLPAPDYISVFGPSVDGVVIKRDLVKEFLSASRKALNGEGGKEAYADGAGADAWAPGMTMNGARGYGLLCGVVTNEAVFRVPDKAIVAGLAGEQRDRMLRTYVRNTYTHHLSEIFSTVVNEYTDWERTAVHPINTRDATVAALSDAQFVAPLVQTGDAIYRVGPASPNSGPAAGPVVPIASAGGMGAILRTDGTGPFFYVFDYQTREGDYPQKLGPAHGEELPYVFGAPLAATVRAFPSNYSKSEVALAEAVMTYWTNFARTGNPNQATPGQHEAKDRSRQRGAVAWEEYDAGHQKYLEMSLKPRMKNHFRAHKMSIWLRLIPELHRAGQEDVVARHNLFRNHNESSLYDGIVRPDPLGRTYGFGPLGAGMDVDETGLLGARLGNATARLSDVFLPVTMPTCLNITGAYHTFGNGSGANGHAQPGHGGGSTSGGDMMEPEGLAAYSTALGVTLAIGCSLLVLNVLIFAGVFYQRDRTRLQVKSLKQQQRIRGACEDLAGGSGGEKAEKQFPHLRHSFSSSVIVDMEREKTACGQQQQQAMHCDKSPVGSMKSSKSGGGLASGLYSGQPPNYSSYLHQDGPDIMLRHSFHSASTFRDGPSRGTATLPRNVGMLGKAQEGVTLGPAAMGMAPTANGCAGGPGGPLHHTLPRPPPPPRVNSRASDHGDGQGHGQALRLPQAALSEMRV